MGRELVGSGGVVREPQLREQAVLSVAGAAAELGLGVAGVVASPLPGPSGNVEFFVWFRRGAPPVDPAAVARAISIGTGRYGFDSDTVDPTVTADPAEPVGAAASADPAARPGVAVDQAGRDPADREEPR